MRLVDSYEYTRLIDLKVAKSYLIENYGTDIIYTDEPELCTCSGCGSMGLFRTGYVGRIRGVKLCDRCANTEKDFLQTLVDFDETEEFEFDCGDAIREYRSQNAAFAELKRTHKLSKDEKRRQELESLGQARLF